MDFKDEPTTDIQVLEHTFVHLEIMVELQKV